MHSNLKKKYHRVLSIAGSDSSGGAGIQADIKTCCALGCYAMTAITALTAQNTIGVQDIYPIPETFVAEQIQSIMTDIGVDAVKIGMLSNKNIVETIGKTIKQFNCPVVLDPVTISTSGDYLLSPDAIKKLYKVLLPYATLVTPNIHEATYLTNTPINTVDDMKKAAMCYAEHGAQNVLIKGGHLQHTDCIDVLYQSKTQHFDYFSKKKITTNNTHGTGCSLSTAIAAELAKGKNLYTAITQAKNYITNGIRSGSEYVLGHGHGPINHLCEQS